jgi:hypothetical protein
MGCSDLCRLNRSEAESLDGRRGGGYSATVAEATPRLLALLPVEPQTLHRQPRPVLPHPAHHVLVTT